MGIGKPFVKGMAKLGGRVKGSRNKISEAFLKDLAAEWEAIQKFVTEIAAASLAHPLRAIAGLEPRPRLASHLYWFCGVVLTLAER